MGSPWEFERALGCGQIMWSKVDAYSVMRRLNVIKLAVEDLVEDLVEQKLHAVQQGGEDIIVACNKVQSVSLEAHTKLLERLWTLLKTVIHQGIRSNHKYKEVDVAILQAVLFNPQADLGKEGFVINLEIMAEIKLCILNLCFIAHFQGSN